MHADKNEKKTECPLRDKMCGFVKLDSRQIQSNLLVLVACAVLIVIGAWIGVMLYRRGGEAGDVAINISVGGKEGEAIADYVQLNGEGEWAQVRVEKIHGTVKAPPPDNKRAEKEGTTAALEFTETNATALFGDEVSAIHFLFVSKKSSPSDDYEKMLAEFEATAKQFQHEKAVKFSYVDADSAVPANIALLDIFAIDPKNELPTVRIYSLAPQQGRLIKYRPEQSKEPEQLDAEKMAAFTRSFLSGELKPYYRSETTPADWDSGAVKVLTGENFEQVAHDPSKHVFVEFYALWCGHCKQLEPVWEQLGEKYQGHSSIVIAKIDAIANEVGDVPVRAFPTIKLFPAAGGVEASDEQLRQGIDYNGKRTVEAFASYLDSVVASNEREEGIAPFGNSNGDDI